MKIESNKSYEIDLLKIVSTIKERIYFIISITISGTLASFLYLSTLSPIYSTSSLITSISIDTQERLNQIINQRISGKKLVHEVDSDKLLNEFLVAIQSESIQQKALSEFDYSNLLDLLKDKNEHKLETKSLLNSINVSIEETNSFLENAYQISIEGKNPDLITKYLNDLMKFSSNKIISQMQNRIDISRKNRIDEINDKIYFLLKKDEKYKLSLIDELERELEIAKNLGIRGTNFESIVSNLNPPNWFLLGEDAIKEKIRSTEDKITNPPKLTEVIDLNNQKDQLEQIKINLDGYNAIQTITSAKIPTSPLWPNSRVFLLFAFFASFLGSIVLSLFYDLLKQDRINQ